MGSPISICPSIEDEFRELDWTYLRSLPHRARDEFRDLIELEVGAPELMIVVKEPMGISRITGTDVCGGQELMGITGDVCARRSLLLR